MVTIVIQFNVHSKNMETSAMSFMRISVAVFLAFFATVVWAQQYPNRAIRLVVPSSPGGAPDVLARVLTEKLALALGQPIVIDNRTGAGGNIGGEIVAKAVPDGHTLLLGWDSMITVNPHLYKTLSYDPMKDLVPVTTISAAEYVLAVHPSVPAKSFQEFVEYAKKTKPPMPYASIGNGSLHQLAMEALKARAGIDLLHIPYKGGTPAATATVAGETLVMVASTAAAPYFKSGRLRPLATMGAKPSADFPGLPALGAIYPGYNIFSWIALFAPAGTPEPILIRLRTELNKLLASAEITERFQRGGGGLNPYITTPDEFAALLRSDYAKYGKAVHDLGIKID
jgi:tripartite-type tricarboxylate transporter receptor subunit TctC